MTFDKEIKCAPDFQKNFDRVPIYLVMTENSKLIFNDLPKEKILSLISNGSEPPKGFEIILNGITKDEFRLWLDSQEIETVNFADTIMKGVK